MKQTELIINPDGSIFHLHLFPEDIADKIIIVGDPDRVDLVSSFFDSVRCSRRNREFYTKTGTYRGKDITVISSGIGTDNIDILINELDAIYNYDLASKKPNISRKSLTIIRIGTSGSLQKNIAPGSFILTEKAIGFDNVMNYYKGIDSITDKRFETLFMKHCKWSARLSAPYIIDADAYLLELFADSEFHKGITISAPGFYAPQGRTLLLEPVDNQLNDKIADFRYEGKLICNYEMESSAIYGLSRLMGHRALTACVVLGNRVTGRFIFNYRDLIEDLTLKILEKI